MPSGPASAEIEVKRSRFLCQIERIESRDNARAVIEKVRKQHHDARHHCSAFVIGPDADQAHSSDDGEPAGTAGAPMLDALRGSGLGDVIAVVTRWFGGVLLGPGGLVRAYGEAVRAGLGATSTHERHLLEEYAVDLDHTTVGRIESDLRGRGIAVLSVDYAQRVRLVFGVPPGAAAVPITRLSELTGGSAHIEMVGRRWVDAAINVGGRSSPPVIG